MDLFVTYLANPSYYFAVVLTVVISITLHELAHGWMAIRLGDRTPLLQGRMTGNPLVHMGPLSIAILLVFGIAWGAMPVDSTRLRGKYGEAKVAVAGPAMNFILAILAMTALGLWWRFAPFDEEQQVARNGLRLLFVCGMWNMLLGIFNLLPVPPLDGSHILANFSRGYASLIADPSKQGMWMLAFFFTFTTAHIIFRPFFIAGHAYMTLLAGNNGYVTLLW